MAEAVRVPVYVWEWEWEWMGGGEWVEWSVP